MKIRSVLQPLVFIMVVSGAICYAESDLSSSEPWKTVYAETEQAKAQIKELELKIMSMRIALDARMSDIKNSEKVAAINRKVIEKLSQELKQRAPSPANKTLSGSRK